MAASLFNQAIRLFQVFLMAAPLVAIGCGDDSSGGRLGQNTTATGGTPAVTIGGASAVATGGSGPVIYANADEGVFPQDRVLAVEVTLPDGAWETMIANAELEQYTKGTVRIDGLDVGEVGVRFKGSYSLESCVGDLGELICDKLSLKIKFSEYDTDKRFYGLKRLNFNNLVDDWALFRERLGYQLFREMDIIAPRTSYATITVNGTSQGLYTVVEEVDGRFTSDRYQQGNGNLYKEAWPVSSEDSYYADHLETNADTATHQVFEAFAAEMQSAKDADLPATLGKWMDLDYLARYMAVDYAIANWDGITTFYCGSWGCGNHNYYIYQEESKPRFWLIPWDLNATLFLDHWLGDIVPWDDLTADCTRLVPTESDPTLSTKAAACDPVIRALVLNREPYLQAVRHLLDEHFTVERLNAEVDKVVTLLTPYIRLDPYLSYPELSGTVTYCKGELAQLRARLEQVVAQQ